MSRRTIYQLLSGIALLLIQACSCEPEDLTKGLMWGFNKLAGDGYFPSQELIDLGGFERVEVSVRRFSTDGEIQNNIALMLYNGKTQEFLENEAGVARKCAEMYANNYSNISEFQMIDIRFVAVDPTNQENYSISEYNFEVSDILIVP